MRCKTEHIFPITVFDSEKPGATYGTCCTYVNALVLTYVLLVEVAAINFRWTYGTLSVTQVYLKLLMCWKSRATIPVCEIEQMLMWA